MRFPTGEISALDALIFNPPPSRRDIPDSICPAAPDPKSELVALAAFRPVVGRPFTVRRRSESQLKIESSRPGAGTHFLADESHLKSKAENVFLLPAPEGPPLLPN